MVNLAALRVRRVAVFGFQLPHGLLFLQPTSFIFRQARLTASFSVNSDAKGKGQREWFSIAVGGLAVRVVGLALCFKTHTGHP